ncbi:MAG: acyltransferase family protein [Lachnospiraceae bacterium]|nr:acyltransferase family protein [Lachnospiraceae bacterium]
MKERVKWVDVLRGIAMFFVIFGHAFVSKDNFIRTYIYSFHMPLFFLISGLTYKKSELKFKEFFFKKCKNLLLPYLFINIFVFIVKLILQYSLGLYNVNLLKSPGSFFIGLGKDLPCIQSWFLISLFIVEILFYLIQRFAKNEKITVLSVVLLAAAGFILSVFSFSFLRVLHIGASLIGLLALLALYLLFI